MSDMPRAGATLADAGLALGTPARGARWALARRVPADVGPLCCFGL
ncbi:hypothetical protein AB0O22_30385 [Streptomyces sp. NPDC091204]